MHTRLVRSGVLLAGVVACSPDHPSSPAADASTDAATDAGSPGSGPTPDVVYPPNAGVFNVKDYGAAGDGSTDDTQAIRAAMNAAWDAEGNIVYFPSGTYLVSDTLEWKRANGQWDAWLRFQGQNHATTTIELKDASPGFGNATCTPMYSDGPIDCKAILFLASSGASDYDPASGSGESGYYDDVFDLTIDAGTGNPGAETIDWNASNTAAIRNVTLRGSGRVALNASRGFGGGGNGPALVKNLTIEAGFDYGIINGAGEVGLTFDHVAIAAPTTAAFWNLNNNSWVRALSVTTTGDIPAIINEGSGNFSIIDSTFAGSGGTSAIHNAAFLYARNVSTTGYAAAIDGVSGTTIAEYASSPATNLFSTTATSLGLPIRETPEPFADNDFANWAIVTDFGATPGSGDSTDAIQRALNAGRATVFFPAGAYTFSGTLHIPTGVRRVIGVYSNLNGTSSSILECDSTSNDPVEIRTFSFAGGVRVVNQCTGPLVIADVFNLYGYENVPGAGLTAFFENAAIPGLVVQHGGDAWARQLDIETDGPHGQTDGASFWVLGYKTEGTGANGNGLGVWTTQNAGSTEIIGAFNSTPGPGNYYGYFSTDSTTSIAGLSSGSERTTVVTETRNGETRTVGNLGNRYGGTAIPLYSGH